MSFQDLFWKRDLVVHPPISIPAKSFADSNSLNVLRDCKNPDYPLSTIIIGDKDSMESFCEWVLKLPKGYKKGLISATLRFETIRVHGLLHSPAKNRFATIKVNEQILDRIELVKQHPHGEDYGIDSQRPYPVLNYLEKSNGKRELRIRIELESGVKWDLDRITMEGVVEQGRVKEWILLVIGAVISVCFEFIIKGIFCLQ